MTWVRNTDAMTVGGRKPRRGLTDEELRSVARFVARTQLEVERGQRDPKVLRSVLAPHLYHDLAHARRPAARPQWP